MAAETSVPPQKMILAFFSFIATPPFARGASDLPWIDESIRLFASAANRFCRTTIPGTPCVISLG
jgi:hypothetical protein